MRTLVLKLFNCKNRPTFSYALNGLDIMALIDSGAETPVWCTGEKKFEIVYPDAKKQNWQTEIRGFGGNLEKASVYIIPEFCLSDGNNTYKILNLQVAVCNHHLIGYDFVMSDTMFYKADTFIHRINNKYIEIFYEKESYQCVAKRIGGTFSVVTFSQEEI